MNGTPLIRIPFEAAEPPAKPKLCRNCKHCVPDRSFWWYCLFLPLAPLFAWWAASQQWQWSRCGRTARPRYKDDGHRYTGERYREKFDHRYCANERERGFSDENPCGPEAKYFEAKP